MYELLIIMAVSLALFAGVVAAFVIQQMEFELDADDMDPRLK